MEKVICDFKEGEIVLHGTHKVRIINLFRVPLTENAITVRSEDKPEGRGHHYYVPVTSLKKVNQ